MPRLLFALAALPLLAACVPAAPPEDPLADACGAKALQGLVGQPAQVLAAMTFSQPLRVIRPGQPVTEDYRPARLNVEVDASERISRVSCG